MSSNRPLKRYSCSRCQAKKIRCNRAEPRCNRCEASGVECVYPPRKTPVRKCTCGVEDKDILSKIIARLDRLERHCQLSHEPEAEHDQDEEMEDCDGGEEQAKEGDASLSSIRSDLYALIGSGSPVSGRAQGSRHSPSSTGTTTRQAWDRIKNPATRPRLISDMFCHLRSIEASLFQDRNCIDAIEAVVDQVDLSPATRGITFSHAPSASRVTVSKKTARQCIETYFTQYQFPGFRVPLEKSFLLSIPDLLENPHVQLDYPSQIIYYTVLLHGLLVGVADGKITDVTFADSEAMTQQITTLCIDFSERWLEQGKNEDTFTPTQADLSAACITISTALEAGNIDLSWRVLAHTCRVAKALGYFQIDAIDAPCHPDTDALERNRKRFEFWHLLRSDCMFRLSLGKPALIRNGEWAVNFPDSPGIVPSDNTATEKGAGHGKDSRIVEIHFLASMRLALVMLRYLDVVDPSGSGCAFEDIDDNLAGDLITEVEAALALWRPDELLSAKTTYIDSWLSVDMLLGSYKTLIILGQARIRNKDQQEGGRLSPYTVATARRSLQTFRSFTCAGGYEYAPWGVSLILLHQVVPLLILCIEIMISKSLSSPESINEADHALLGWVKGFVLRTAEKRAELRSVTTMMQIMILVAEDPRRKSNSL